MCFFSKPDLPPVQQAVPPPPPAPPPAQQPTAPVFNESSTQSRNASQYSAALRRGTSSLTIPLGSGNAGLQIPN